MNTVSLKIELVEQGRLKTLQFGAAESVDNALKIIHEKTEVGSPDLGLFLCEDQETKSGRWLESGKTLAYYDLQNGDTLQLRTKRKPLRVKLPDESTKVAMIDESNTVAQIVRIVCERAMINNPDEYLIQYNGAWLDPDQTLSQQNVPSEETLTLGKRLHFHDGEIDRSDPIALNLLYIESRDKILDGTHPVTRDEAIQFAALMCQIMHGNHDPNKHKKGFLKLEEVLPKEYVGTKEADKEIFKEHRKLVGMSELNAKYRYMQLCRALKTYGVTFFTVKESSTNNGRKVLVPVILGITREAILRMDPETKAVIHHYPLTHLRRWAPAPNSFTFDFGDYEDSYYTVQTNQGDALSQLLTQYIDIQRKDREKKLQAEQSEQQAAYEDTVGGAMGHGVTASSTGGKLKAGELTDAASAGGLGGVRGGVGVQGQMGKKGSGAVGGMGATGVLGIACQREIDNAMLAGRLANQALSDECPNANYVALDPASEALRMEKLKQARLHIQGAVKGESNAAGIIVNQMAGASDIKQVDTNALASAFKLLAENSPLLAEAARLAVMQAGANEAATAKALWNAARDLSAASNKLIMAANVVAATMAAGDLDPRAREDLLAAAQAIGASSSLLLACASCQEVDTTNQQKLVDAAKLVAQATALMVQNAKTCASKLGDPNSQQQIVNGAKASAIAASTLVAVTKSTAATINYEPCERQLLGSASALEKAGDNLVACAATVGADDESQLLLGNAKAGMLSALQALRDAIIEAQKSRYDELERAATAIKAATGSLVQSIGNSDAIIKYAKETAGAVNLLVQAAKIASAAEPDPLIQQQFMQAAKAIADAASRLLQASAAAAKAPADPTLQGALKESCGKLDALVTRFMADIQRKQAFQRLAEVAKKAIDSMGNLMNAGKAAVPVTAKPEAQKNLDTNIKGVSITTGKLLQSVNNFNENPRDTQLQTQLVLAAKSQLQPSTRLLQAVQGAAPSVSDGTIQGAFVAAAKAAAIALQNLSKAVKTATEATGFIDIDASIESVNGASADVDAVLITANMEMLECDKSVDAEQAQTGLKDASKELAEITSKLLDASARAAHEEVGPLSQATAKALQALVAATRTTAVTTSSSDAQVLLLGGAKNTADVTSSLLQVCKQALATPMDSANNERLAQAANKISASLGRLLSSMPGIKECEDTISALKKAQGQLNVATLPTPPPGMTFGQASEEMSATVRELTNDLSAMTIKATLGPDAVADGAKLIADVLPKYVMGSQMAAASCGDMQSQAVLLAKAQELAQAGVAVMAVTKAVAANRSDTSLQAQLNAAMKGVSDAMANIFNTIQSCFPGMRDCEESLDRINGIVAVLDKRPEVPMGATFFAVADQVQKNARDLATSAAKLLGTSKNAAGQEEVLGRMAKQCVTNLSALVSATMVSAGLAGGVAPGPSKATLDGLVQDVHRAGDELSVAPAGPEMLTATAAAARASGALVNEAKTMQAVEKDASKKKSMAAASKAMVQATSELVAAVKVAVGNPESEAAKAAIDKAVSSLKKAATELGNVCKAAVPTPNQTVDQATNEKAVVENAKKTAEATRLMAELTKALAAAPKDSALQSKLSGAARGVSEAISSLLTSVKAAAPGMKDCDSVLASLRGDVADLETAHINATTGQLTPAKGANLMQCQEEVMAATKELSALVNSIVNAATISPIQVGAAALSCVEPAQNVTKAAIAAASTTTDGDLQQRLLNLTKAMCEQMSALVEAARTSSVSPLDQDLNSELVAQQDHCNTTIAALVSCVREGVSAQRECDVAIDEIGRALEDLCKPIEDASKIMFSKAQSQVSDAAKDLLKAVSAMQMQSRTEPEKLGAYASQVSGGLTGLVKSIRAAGGAIPDEEIMAGVLEMGKEVAMSCMSVVESAKELSLSPKSKEALAEVETNAKATQKTVADLMSSIKEAATGQRECDEAIHVISQQVADLDTQSMFVTGEPMPLTSADDTFPKYEELLKTTLRKAQADITQVTDGAKDPKALGAAAMQLSKATSEVLELAKAAMPTLSELKNRRDVLGAARDILNTMCGMIGNAQQHSSDPLNPDLLTTFTDSVKGCNAQIETAITQFARISIESMAGIKTCGDMNKLIVDDANSILAGMVEVLDATPEEAVESAKTVAQATAKLVTATKGTQKQLADAARENQRAMNVLFLNCRGAAMGAADSAAKDGMLAAARSVADAMKMMMAHITESGLKIRDQEQQQKLVTISKTVADKIKSVIDSARAIKGELYDLDEDDPNSVAERELHQAARAIEAAAKKLAALKPKPKPKDPNAMQQLSLDESIVAACQEIAKATGMLIKAGTAAQHELVLQGRASDSKKKMYHADATWADGLISAAQAVAGATSQLAEQANKLVKSGGDEFALIAAAKSVAASTAQVVAASRAKGDPMSPNQIKLADASKAVRAATEGLVKVAQESAVQKDEEEAGDLGDVSMARARVLQMEQEAKIQKLQKDLERARNEMGNIHKSAYKKQ